MLKDIIKMQTMHDYLSLSQLIMWVMQKGFENQYTEGIINFEVLVT